MIDKARARERIAVVIQEQAGAILTANPDIHPADIVANIADYIDPQLFGARGNSPILRRALVNRIKALSGLNEPDAPAVPADACPLDAPTPAQAKRESEAAAMRKELARVNRELADARELLSRMGKVSTVSVKPAAVVRQPETAADMVAAWRALGVRDGFADSLAAYFDQNGRLSARQLYFLGRALERARYTTRAA